MMFFSLNTASGVSSQKAVQQNKKKALGIPRIADSLAGKTSARDQGQKFH